MPAHPRPAHRPRAHDPRAHRPGWIALACAALLAAPQATHAADCHEYEGDAVSLLGTIRIEIFPGPPAFLSVHRGDRPEYELVLELDEPFCIHAEPEREEGPLPGIERVEKVQALMPIDLPLEAELLGRLGEEVWLHGKLVPPSDRYHYLPVLIRANRMTPVLFERPDAPEIPDLPGIPTPATESG